jgi:hypothetical protein
MIRLTNKLRFMKFTYILPYSSLRGVNFKTECNQKINIPDVKTLIYNILITIVAKDGVKT